IGIPEVVSSTSSDWMRLNLPGIKMGPGDTNRSHKADEFIFKSELCDAIDKYIDFIKVLEL
ncbi:MAG: acetylornithine deacetylase, partial [Bacteroidales bacterium]|nr:acetylornithine deacetylase [Bacteroidales bacterium]